MSGVSTFSGSVSRRLVSLPGRSVEAYYLRLQIEEPDATPADNEITLDEYEFTDQPKLGPAVVYRRTLSPVPEHPIGLGLNVHESIVQEGEPEIVRPPARPPTDFIELAWGFTDTYWDSVSSDRWFSARCVVKHRQGCDEVVVLQRAANVTIVRTSIASLFEEEGWELLTQIEVEDTAIARPGVRTPPIFYIAND